MDQWRRTVKNSICTSTSNSCCQQTAERAIDTVLENLSQENSASICPSISASSPIAEQDETQGDDTLIEDSWTTDLSIWGQCRSYELTQHRTTHEKMAYSYFETNMRWLDEVLVLANTKFGSSQVVTSLPKTPAVKHKQKMVNSRASSPLPVDLSTIEKPTKGRSKRTAAVKAKERIVSAAPSGRRATRQQSKANALNAAETATVPKKIARFSRLAHVKDKVNAFEQFTDGTPASKTLTSTPSASPASPATPLTVTRLHLSPTPPTVTREVNISPTEAAGSTAATPSDAAAGASKIVQDKINEASPALKPSGRRSSVKKVAAQTHKTNRQTHKSSEASKTKRSNAGSNKCTIESVTADATAMDTAENLPSAVESRDVTPEGRVNDEQDTLAVSVETAESTSTISEKSSRNRKSVSSPATNISPDVSSVDGIEAQPKPQAPQRMTRSKLRVVQAAAPTTADLVKPAEVTEKQKTAPSRSESKDRGRSPTRSKVVAKTKTPLRVEMNRPLGMSEGKTRVASADRSRLPALESGKKKRTNSVTGSSIIPRVPSESNLYTSSSIVRTLTKAASATGLNKPVNSHLSKHHTISTPDMSRTQSFVKNMIRGTPRTSPQQTPSFGKTVVSFLKRATPVKTLTKEEEVERKEMKLRAKEELDRQRREEAEKLKLEQREARKRERAEKMKKVQDARQAKLEESRTKRKELEKKTLQKCESTQQAQERKLREEREKALIREQKLVEVEERRKREEERKMQKLKANEAEQKRHADAMARKREYEEADRLKKQEAEKNRLLKKTADDRNAGKITALNSKPAGKPSIYDDLSSKRAALTEEKNAFKKAANVVRPDQFNSTFTKDKQQACNNFIDIKMTEADDEFEDPKYAKCVKPSWAQGHKLNTALVNQFTAVESGIIKPDELLGKFYGYTPDLTKVFPVHKPVFFKRTSSAMWNTPPMKKSKV